MTLGAVVHAIAFLAVEWEKTEEQPMMAPSTIRRNPRETQNADVDVEQVRGVDWILTLEAVEVVR